MGFIKGMSVRKLSSRLTMGFIAIILAISVLGFYNTQVVGELHKNWAEYKAEAESKSFLLNELHDVIGYGGAIHQFKNYVLRQDAPRLVKIENGFTRAQEILSAYGKLNVTAGEKQALSEISAVFANYLDAVPVVQVMADEGASSQEIDQKVKINDTPAVEGMQFLDEKVKAVLTGKAIEVENKQTTIQSVIFYGSIGTSLLLVGMLVILILAFRTILKQIGGEPKTIMTIARRISEGDLSEELSTADDNESVFSAVVCMQKDLRSRSENDARTSAGNERLRQALDNASSSVMVADNNNNIVFMNKSTTALLQNRESEIRAHLPHFKAADVVGSNIDVFHKKPEVQQQRMATLKSSHSVTIDFVGCAFKLTVNPVVLADGERVGSIVEWFDITEQLKSEANIRNLVESATRGELHERIDVDSASGFYRNLSQSMNDLMEVNERAVSEVQNVFAAIAKGDLTAKIDSGYMGMYKRLKDNANDTVDRLTEVISRVKDSSLIIAAASTELVSTNKSLTATAEDGAKQADTAASAAANVMQNVNAVANATTDMEQSVQEITRNVGEAAGVATQAVTLAQTTNTQVRKLATSSNDIGNVIKVINSIAEQTNLLALNATIEAARAGDAGKGFAVVANEVKDLAKGTASATDEIAQKVKAIQDDSDTAVQAIGDITKIIETISQYQNTISEKVGEQHIATRHISENANEAARGNDEITYTSKRVSEGIDSTVSGVGQVQSSAEELGRMANELSDLVEGFTIFERQ